MSFSGFKHSEQTLKKMSVARIGMQAIWINSDKRAEICAKISAKKTKHFPQPCILCGKNFKPRGKKSKYCSNICSHKANRGRKMPEITRLAIRKANVGRKKLNPITPLNKLLRTGLEWKRWRQAIFERDEYTCQICGAHNENGIGKTIELHPDHIMPFALFPKLRFDISN